MKTTDIITDIIAQKKHEIELQKQQVSMKQLQNQLTNTSPQRSMRKALIESSTGIIAEFKRRSPSKGWLKETAKVAEIIPAYIQSGATALSILTDERFFGGNLRDILTARSLADIPILRKDFIIDEYQLHQTKKVGADVVLLIAAALTEIQCQSLTKKAHELGLEVLLEIHQKEELAYITPEIDMVGINNRNLGTFHTNIENSFQLARLLPKSVTLISESGISSPVTVRQLRENGCRGFLIGETFMRTNNPGETLNNFIHSI